MNKLFHVEWGTVFRLKTLSHNTHTDNCVVVLSADIPPVLERHEAKGDSNSVTGTSNAVDRMKTLVIFHVLSVTGRPVAVDCLLGVRDLNISFST
jgi:hypothetical protein